MSTRHPTRARLVGGRYAVDGRLLRTGVVLDGVDLAGEGRRVRVRALAAGEPEPAGVLARLREGDLELAVLAPPARRIEAVVEPDCEPGAERERRRAAAARGLGRRALAALAVIAAVLGALVVHGLPTGGRVAIAPAAAAPLAPAPVTPTRSVSSPTRRPARRAPPARRRRPTREPRRIVRRAGARPRVRPAGSVPPRLHAVHAPTSGADAPAAADAPPAAPADGEVPPAA